MIYIMIKTQIQLPETLYRELKRVAAEREMSLAEVLRRGAEYITQVYLPIEKGKPDAGLPGPFNVGVKGDPFANPNWRYELSERSMGTHVARETRRSSYGARIKKKR
jgi:hypothetical protein